jgi:zinc protease
LTYTKTVREEAGGTYGVGTSVSISPIGKKNNAMVVVQFDTNEDKVAELVPIVKNGLQGIAENGVSAEYMTKILENMNKVYKENQINNGYWSGLLKSYYGQGIEKYENYVEVLNSLTSEDVKEFASTLLKKARYIECVMNPEK